MTKGIRILISLLFLFITIGSGFMLNEHYKISERLFAEPQTEQSVVDSIALSDSVVYSRDTINSSVILHYTTGNNNVCLGDQTLSNNITGNNNIAIGYQAGRCNTYKAEKTR